MNNRKSIYTLGLLGILFLSLSASTGCKGRKIRAEFIEFAKTIEESRSVADNLVKEFDTLDVNVKSPEQAAQLGKALSDMVARIDTMLGPVKALSIETEEIVGLRDNYLRAWESLRDALDLLQRVIASRDPKMGMTLGEQLAAKMNIFMESSKVFETNYKQLSEKYAVTLEDIGVHPAAPPVTPLPFSPLPPSSPSNP